MQVKTVTCLLAAGPALGAMFLALDGAGLSTVQPSPRAVPVRPLTKQNRDSGTDLRRSPDGAGDSPFVGALAAPQPVILVATEGGRLRTVRVAAGDVVHRGELLAEIAPDDLDLQRQVQAARVREAGVAVERARLQVGLNRRKMKRREHYPELFSLEDREETKLQLDSAVLELEAARAREAEAEAQLRLLRRRRARSRIVAPRDALVSERLVDPGATVFPGQPMFQLVDASARIVRFALPADPHRRVAVGMTVRAIPAGTVPEADAAGWDSPESCATIERISPKVADSAPLLFVDARLASGALAGLPLGTALRVSVVEAGECGGKPEEGSDDRPRS
jgi:RND family efflux transporter MFP subunit